MDDTLGPWRPRLEIYRDQLDHIDFMDIAADVGITLTQEWQMKSFTSILATLQSGKSMPTTHVCAAA